MGKAQDKYRSTKVKEILLSIPREYEQNLLDAVSKCGVSRAGYVKQALIEQLEEAGYLLPENENSTREITKVIDGKMYNTSTATVVCRQLSSSAPSEPLVVNTPYQKQNGEFFFVQTGGGRSECVAPTTEAEAKSFAEKAMTGKEYVAYFGEVSE